MEKDFAFYGCLYFLIQQINIKMKFLKLSIITLLTLGMFGLGSCKDDDDDHDDHDHEVTIEIVSPANEATISDCSNVTVEVNIITEDEVHEAEIVLHPESDTSDKIIDFDEHSHESSVEFNQSVDLCGYDAGTCFHLEVSVCKDHDCEETETEEVEFCLE